MRTLARAMILIACGGLVWLGSLGAARAEPPPEWQCSSFDYADGIICDCECGAWDPDCDDDPSAYFDCDGFDAICVYPGVCETGASACLGWICDDSYYDAGDGCDCDCGCWDPDCDIPGAEVYGCTEGQTCEQPGICAGGGTGTETCVGWTCDASYYGAGDGCDCDCGCWDTDCDTPGATVYGCAEGEICEPPGVCGGGGPPPSTCLGWTCDAYAYDANDGCHCGCGCWDPDCDSGYGQIIGCGSGQTCEPPGVCAGDVTDECLNWTCDADYYSAGDGCDCNCGCWDPDCNNPYVDVYNCNEGQICIEPGVCHTPSCIPDCMGRECGDNGCGGVCGECPSGWSCDANGNCQGGCQPNCDGRNCGPDPACGMPCGSCGLGQTCVDGVCAAAPCEPSCGDRICGDDGCGGSCGSCPVGMACNGEGHCGECTPFCGDRQCGDDGCGGSCGTCESGSTCDELGRCIVSNVPVIPGPDAIPSLPDAGTQGGGGSGGSCAAGAVGPRSAGALLLLPLFLLFYGARRRRGKLGAQE